MIVKCEQCQTRFKIPDEKVTDKGVKVRCTKCQNTFRVTREAAAPSAPAPADPFAIFGPAPEPKAVDITKPRFFPEGVEATKTSPAPPSGKNWHGANEEVDDEVFEERTRVGPIPLPPEALPPAAPPAPSAPPPIPSATRPGVAAPRSATTLFGSAPAPGGPSPLPAVASAPAPRAAPSAPAGLAVDDDPFANIDLSFSETPPSPAQALQRTAASAPASATPPAGALALGPVRPSTPSTPVSPFDGEDPFASLDFGMDPAPPAAAAPPAPPPLPRAPAAPAKPPPAAAAPTPPVSSGPDRSMFDLGDSRMPSEAAEFKVSEPDDGASAVGRKEVLDLPDLPDLAALGDTHPAAPELSGPIAKPAGRPEDMGLPDGEAPSALRRVMGLFLNLAVAAVLLVGVLAVGSVYLHEGRVDLSVLSPARLQALMTPSQPLVARDISNGLYETREGHPLFIVRGQVENRGASAARVKVRAALYDDDQRVKSQEGLAGAAPGPEELHAIASTEAAAALRARLDASATSVPPGGRAPFVLVFQEYPEELDAFRLEVTLEPVAASEEAPKGGAK